MKTCPQCAEEVKKAARLCRYCGFRFAPRSEIATAHPLRSSRGAGLGLWAVGVAVVAALALPAVVDRVNRAEDRLARLSTPFSMGMSEEAEDERRRQLYADSGDEVWLGVGSWWREVREALGAPE